MYPDAVHWEYARELQKRNVAVHPRNVGAAGYVVEVGKSHAFREEGHVPDYRQGTLCFRAAAGIVLAGTASLIYQVDTYDSVDFVYGSEHSPRLGSH